MVEKDIYEFSRYRDCYISKIYEVGGKAVMLKNEQNSTDL
jgi:hypothetical protein